MRRPKEDSLTPEQQLLQGNPVPVIITNSAGTILFRNNAAQRQLPLRRTESILPYLHRDSAPLFEQLRLHGGAHILHFRENWGFDTASAFSYLEEPTLRRVILQFFSQKQITHNAVTDLLRTMENDLAQNLTVIAGTAQILNDTITDPTLRNSLAVVARNCKGALSAQRAIALYHRLLSNEPPHESLINLQLLVRVLIQEFNHCLDPLEHKPIDVRVIRPGKETDYLAVLDSCELANLMMPVLYWGWLCAQDQVFVTLARRDEHCEIEMEYHGEPPMRSRLEQLHPRPQARAEVHLLVLRYMLSQRLCNLRGWPFCISNEDEQTRIHLQIPFDRAAIVRSRTGQSAQEAAIEAARHMAGVDARCFFFGSDT